MRHLYDLQQNGLPRPAVHQMEMNPMWHDEELLQHSGNEGTAVQVYGCLGGSVTGGSLMKQEATRKTADRYKVTPGQVLLRWASQRGVTVITGGSSDSHIEENIGIFNFELIPGDADWFSNWVQKEDQKKAYRPLPDDIL
eukprot:TRINITY_DN2621_c3_g1_i4.p2 TRINITY_DN2621_c3_g1~~TRINITY_DN2621_c3_g1_i4.p2  ORF type:complete len:140 (+),score=28.24 TRINITY_DN2621_c3_g1_i4:83-502(+)